MDRPQSHPELYLPNEASRSRRVVMSARSWRIDSIPQANHHRIDGEDAFLPLRTCDILLLSFSASINVVVINSMNHR